ncbi:hypothetical protein ACFSHT_22200 [Paraburkholderia silviterrae]|uniref:Uncharacterized protein n=1 Tax=Paraburkholderia silviterrae TaxID=2528715 RepID=A0A4R5MGL8_9BURK|nr:hypothetical protein [Paraburkholderia silviterrae]TDG25900.1 hypothetical protein EYW47_00580 [Paraburkholderia silviterrae]
MRADIEKYLATVQHSTSKTIADRIGIERGEVCAELNRMHSEGVIERGKKPGGGNEYLYWLMRNDDVERLEAAIGAPTMPAVQSEASQDPQVEMEKPEAAQDELDRVLRIAELEKERDDLRTKIFDLTRSGANRQDKIGSLEAKVETLRTEVEAVTGQRDELRRENQSLSSKCRVLQAQLNEYDERHRFEMWFHAHPEWQGESETIKNRMLEAWLERSRVLEVEV